MHVERTIFINAYFSSPIRSTWILMFQISYGIFYIKKSSIILKTKVNSIILFGNAFIVKRTDPFSSHWVYIHECSKSIESLTNHTDVIRFYIIKKIWTSCKIYRSKWRISSILLWRLTNLRMRSENILYFIMAYFSFFFAHLSELRPKAIMMAIVLTRLQFHYFQSYFFSSSATGHEQKNKQKDPKCTCKRSITARNLGHQKELV